MGTAQAGKFWQWGTINSYSKVFSLQHGNPVLDQFGLIGFASISFQNNMLYLINQLVSNLSIYPFS